MRVPGFDDVLRRIREAGEGRHGQGIGDRQVAEVERKLGVTLPPGYRSFLREFGWLSAAGTEVFGLGEDVPSSLDLRAVAEEAHRVGLPPHAVPFARDAAGAIYCLDTTHSGPYESPVYRWRPEGSADDVLEYMGHDFASWLWMRLAEEP
jgi:hypothetical protein